MKTKKVLLIIPLLFLIIGMGGCEDEMKKLFFENFTLNEEFCQWRQFEVDTVIIVNTKTELGRITICTENLPEIDFDDYSLVFAGGTAIHGVGIIVRHLYEVSNNSLILELKDRNSGSIVPTVETPWAVAVLSQNLPQNTNIELRIKK